MFNILLVITAVYLVGAYLLGLYLLARLLIGKRLHLAFTNAPKQQPFDSFEDDDHERGRIPPSEHDPQRAAA